jgi:nucleotide-binding universal stress UspA family protein
MSIRNILVEVDSRAQAGDTVEAAAALARQLQAKLSGFFVMPDVALMGSPAAGEMMSPRLVEDLQEDAETRAQQAEDLFQRAAGDVAAPNGWLRADGQGLGAGAAAAAAAHYTDLVVMGGPDREESDISRTILPQDLVTECGRPLLFNPEAGKGKTFGKRVVVGWTESREAARAVFDSLPFLKNADQVSLVTVAKSDEEVRAPVQKMAQVLETHGVNAVPEPVVAKDSQSTSDVLFEYATRKDFDLLVAGAYSHSRLREGLFGGVSKSIFESAPLPVLLSH